MRYFISVGRRAGILYADLLIAQLRQRDPLAVFEAYRQVDGIQASDAPRGPWTVLGPNMGESASSTQFVRSTPRNVARALWEAKPDLVILVDHSERDWDLARIANSRQIPVYSYVPPQSWARRRLLGKTPNVPENVEILCTLPFEEAWYRQLGADRVTYVGHPHFDVLQNRTFDHGFLLSQQARTRNVVALLPGSRESEIRSNIRLMVDIADRLHRRVPGTRFLVATQSTEHLDLLVPIFRRCRLPVELHAQRTLEVLELADAAVAAPGLVSLELLHFAKPAAFVCNVLPWVFQMVKRTILQSPYVALPNLFAGRQLYPEFLGRARCCDLVTDQIHGWLTDAEKSTWLRAELQRLKGMYTLPGATRKVAEIISQSACEVRKADRLAA